MRLFETHDVAHKQKYSKIKGIPQFLDTCMDVFGMQPVILQTKLSNCQYTSFVYSRGHHSPQKQSTSRSPELKVGNDISEFFGNIPDVLKHRIESLTKNAQSFGTFPLIQYAPDTD